MSQVIPLTEHFAPAVGSHCSENGEKNGRFYCANNHWAERLKRGASCDSNAACASDKCVSGKCVGDPYSNPMTKMLYNYAHGRR